MLRVRRTPPGCADGGTGAPWFPLAKNMKRILKRPLLNILENHAIAYPTPSNISYL